MTFARFLIVITLAFSWMTAASAQTVIRVSSWAPPTHAINAVVWPAWGKLIEQASEGRVTIKIEYNLGPPPAQMDLIRDGVADATWMFHGYNPGRFLLTKAVELPGLGTNAEAASVAYWRVHQKYFADANEHEGVTLVGLTSHGPGIIHTKQPIAQLEDLKDLKIRIGGGVSADVGNLLGVVGVQVPAPKVYETLAQGVADGIFMPMETKKSFRLKEVAPFSMIMPGGLYYGSFAFVMNTDTLESLDEQDRAAVMQASGEVLSRIAGQAWDAADEEGLADAEASGNTIVTADDAIAARYSELVAPIEQAWIEEAGAKGIDAAAALAELREIARSYKSE
jgi:TRAP-type C4-dicarboxylate transport system substrate-binding protein